MKKFDIVYEKLLKRINEKAYVDSTFFDNIKLLIRVLQENDYVSSDKIADEYATEILNQTDNVKKILLDTKEQSIPPIKLHVTQDSDSESFSVTVINVQKPDEQKEFKNTMLETIFDDVVSYVKEQIVQGLQAPPVEEMPQEEGPNAQPGGGESALPEVAPEQQPLAPTA
jgi:hypothetical protein